MHNVFKALMFYLPMEECAAIVRQRPTEFKIFSDETLWRSVAWNGLELFNQSGFRRVLGAATSPGQTGRPVGAPGCMFRQKSGMINVKDNYY
jgi:hypothetical protein